LPFSCFHLPAMMSLFIADLPSVGGFPAWQVDAQAGGQVRIPDMSRRSRKRDSRFHLHDRGSHGDACANAEGRLAPAFRDCRRQPRSARIGAARALGGLLDLVADLLDVLADAL